MTSAGLRQEKILDHEKKVRYIQYNTLDFTGFTVLGPQLSLSDASRLEQEVSKDAPWHHVWVDSDMPGGFKVNLSPQPVFQRYKSELKEELFRKAMDKTLQHFGTNLSEASQDCIIKRSFGNEYF